MATNSPSIGMEALSLSRWEDLERLVGAKGACAGCWCMSWWLEAGFRVVAPKPTGNQRVRRPL